MRLIVPSLHVEGKGRACCSPSQSPSSHRPVDHKRSAAALSRHRPPPRFTFTFTFTLPLPLPPTPRCPPPAPRHSSTTSAIPPTRPRFVATAPTPSLSAPRPRHQPATRIRSRGSAPPNRASKTKQHHDPPRCPHPPQPPSCMSGAPLCFPAAPTAPHRLRALHTAHRCPRVASP